MTMRAVNLLRATRDLLWKLTIANSKGDIDLKDLASTVDFMERLAHAEISRIERGEFYEDEEEDPLDGPADQA